MKLDATPFGEPLYRKLGFVTEYEIERWILKRPHNTIEKQPTSCELALSEAQLEPILQFDRDIFGAERSLLLNSLRAKLSDLAMSFWSDGAPRGYSFSRSGLFADHFGPWVAKHRPVAEKLPHEFLTHSSREILIVDCLTANTMATELLRSYGFARSRPLTRCSGAKIPMQEILNLYMPFLAPNLDEIRVPFKLSFASVFARSTNHRR
jgi:Acetyltransferase (GNAT) domain